MKNESVKLNKEYDALIKRMRKNLANGLLEMPQQKIVFEKDGCDFYITTYCEDLLGEIHELRILSVRLDMIDEENWDDIILGLDSGTEVFLDEGVLNAATTLCSINAWLDKFI